VKNARPGKYPLMCHRYDAKIALGKVSRQTEHASIYGRMELDSHADTVVLGRNCVILSYTGRECDVSPYTDVYDAIKEVPIVTGATAWTSQVTGETCILVFHEALWMGDTMDHSLLNPNQMRHYGINVHDNPYGDVQMHLESEDGNVTLPLHSEGTTIYLQSRTPTEKELQTCVHVHLTSAAPWDPREVCFPEPKHLVEEGSWSKLCAATN
jgi:hypothetical protein